MSSLIKKYSPNLKTRPFIGMNPKVRENLEFSSLFEGGNLDKVVKVKENEYDLYIRCDSNAKWNSQWYYFSINNYGENADLRINIVNFVKKNSLYTQGLRPCVLRMQNLSKGWNRAGDKLVYSYSKVNSEAANRRGYYSLSFSYRLHKGDTAYFAYSIPYTYTDLLRYISRIKHSENIEIGTLCQTVSGVNVPLLTITDFSVQNRKQLVVLTGRVHPGETHSSIVLEGLIDSLLSSSSKSKSLLKECIFKIVPMLNPDGVIAGNTRCNLTGDDLNRQFSFPDRRLHSPIFAIKALLHTLQKEHKIMTYIDFHAHSQRKGSFMYGPQYPLHSDRYFRIRIIPKLVSEITAIFRFHSCKFEYDWSKRATARLVICDQYKLPLSFTLETSSHAFLDSERKIVEFTYRNLKTLGESVLFSIYEYSELLKEGRPLEGEKRLNRMKKHQSVTREPSQSPRRLADIISAIKCGTPGSDDSNSSDSDFEPTEEEKHQQTDIKRNIINQLDRLDRFTIPQPIPFSFPAKTARKIEKTWTSRNTLLKPCSQPVLSFSKGKPHITQSKLFLLQPMQSFQKLRFNGPRKPIQVKNIRFRSETEKPEPTLKPHSSRGSLRECTLERAANKP